MVFFIFFIEARNKILDKIFIFIKVNILLTKFIKYIITIVSTLKNKGEKMINKLWDKFILYLYSKIMTYELFKYMRAHKYYQKEDDTKYKKNS